MKICFLFSFICIVSYKQVSQEIFFIKLIWHYKLDYKFKLGCTSRYINSFRFLWPNNAIILDVKFVFIFLQNIPPTKDSIAQQFICKTSRRRQTGPGNRDRDRLLRRNVSEQFRVRPRWRHRQPHRRVARHQTNARHKIVKKKEKSFIFILHSNYHTFSRRKCYFSLSFTWLIFLRDIHLFFFFFIFLSFYKFRLDLNGLSVDAFLSSILFLLKFYLPDS